MTALTIVVAWLSVFAFLRGVRLRSSESEPAGRLVRDGKELSTNDLSLNKRHLRMTRSSQQHREGKADADEGKVPTASELMGGASKGLGLDELWEGYKKCSNEYEAEVGSKAIENMTEAMIRLATDLATAAVPFGDGSRASALVKATFNSARKTATYAKTKCIPETRLVKRLVQESIQLLKNSLANQEEMKKNREYLMKTLGVLDGTTEKLRKKMNLSLKQLAVITEKIDALDKAIVRQAEKASRSFEELENFYRQNISEESVGLTMSHFQKALWDFAPLRRVHGLLLRFISFNGTDKVVFREKHEEIVRACSEVHPSRLLNILQIAYFYTDNEQSTPGRMLPLFFDGFRIDAVQLSTFFYQVLADMLLAITVMPECAAARGVHEDAIRDDLAFVQKTVPKVLVAFQQSFKSYQKEYLTMWTERPVPTPLNYIPLVVGQFKRAVSPSRVDPVMAAEVRRTKLFLFRSFLAYTPEGPNANVQPAPGHIDERDTVAGADYSRNWGFIVNRYDTNKSKRDFAVVYADKCTYNGSGLSWAQGWGCNAAVGYALPLNASEDNIVRNPHRIAKKCYDYLAQDIANVWAGIYARSTDPKWQNTLTPDTLYSRVPEIFAEIESREPELLKGFLEPDFKWCKAPAFLPMAIHYGISFSKAPWLPIKNTTYYYADPGESYFRSNNVKTLFYFHAIVYY